MYLPGDMPPKPVFITSDVHLGAVPADTVASFHRWLRHAADAGDTIVVNGDLFDFWFEYRSAIPRGHSRTLGLMAELVDHGTRLILLGGNHDWWGGTFLTEEIGVEFHREPVKLDLGGWPTLLAHGDGVGEGDRGYRFLQKVLRSRLAVRGFRWLHPDIGAGLAHWVSRTEARALDGHPEYGEQRNEMIRRWAHQQLLDDPELQIVTFGHTHLPSLTEVEENRYILNTGDWVYRKTYAIFEPGAPPFIRSWEEPDR